MKYFGKTFVGRLDSFDADDLADILTQRADPCVIFDMIYPKCQCMVTMMNAWVAPLR